MENIIIKKKCLHRNLTCINQYDLIRKYFCADCKEIMMCSCEKEHGERFLPHQLDKSRWLENKVEVIVTLGFQNNVCNECRGQKLISAPKAELYGSNTKVQRYYWREIQFETTKRFFNSNPQLDPLSHLHSEFSYPEKRRLVEKEVISEIKELHKTNPKYEYTEVSQQEIIKQTNTEIVQEKAIYVKTENKKVRVLRGSEQLTVEKYVMKKYLEEGYNVLETESRPFHVLYAVFMALIVLDSSDEHSHLSIFSSRTDFDNNNSEEGKISTFLPDDFGCKGYFERLKKKIKKHINELDDLEWAFEYWQDFSYPLRQYLWAHREEDIEKARLLISIIKPAGIKKVLHYLSMDYWKHYCGWPDLVVYNDKEFFFLEVKSSKDKLSEDQKRWLLGNKEFMKFKTKIFKVIKS